MAKDQSVYTLGQTGDTVVYIFPGGNALLDRENKSVGHKLKTLEPQVAAKQATVAEMELASEQEKALVTRLVREGQITEAQYTVASYDQKITGLTLVEALIARGWLSPDIVN